MDFTTLDRSYMAIALEEAAAASKNGDIPVGAVIVDQKGNIISRRRNERESRGSSIAHAEMLCPEDACKERASWRLSDCTIYVTLEPCPMCAGAILNSRIKRVVCGAKNPKAGSFGSVIDLNSYPLNHKCDCEFGLFNKESSSLLSEFFDKKRKGNLLSIDM